MRSIEFAAATGKAEREAARLHPSNVRIKEQGAPIGANRGLIGPNRGLIGRIRYRAQ